jgi:Flp pilus assembly CpaF family ATPase
VALAPAAAPAPPPRRVDFTVVRELRRELSERLTLWQRGRDFTVDEEDVERARIAVDVVSGYADAVRRAGTPMPADEERQLLQQVTAELVGLGRLQTLLVDQTIEEVHILGCDQVRITRHGGGVDWADPIADSDEELVEILQAAARRAGATERSLSTAKPTLDLQLPDGSRLAAVYLVSSRPYAVIRKHNTLDVSLDDIAGFRADLDEMVDVLLRDFLRAAMRAGLNIMVAGLAGAGKTTVVRALMDEIPPDEPFVLLEESRELLPARRQLRHRAVMSFEAREGHGERGLDGRPAGEVTIADLIPVSLRMGVLRIVVGEVRSREIVPMLQAMTTSRGSMCTIHARTPAGVTERIIELALSHGREMTVDQARRMAGNALDLIVYVTVEDETAIGGRKHRFVSHVEEVIGAGEGNRITTTEVFGPGPDGRAVPKHLPERVRQQLLRIGYDARLLSPYIEAGAGAWRRPRHTRLGRR